MKLRVISVGSKCPGWIRQGFDEYAKRLPREMPLSLVEVPAPRHHQDSAKVDEYEAKKISEKITPSDWVIALDEAGRQLDSKGVSLELNRWRDMGKDVVFFDWGSERVEPRVIGSGGPAPLTLRTDLPPLHGSRVACRELVSRLDDQYWPPLPSGMISTKAPLS